jgi:hypothetical protein
MCGEYIRILVAESLQKLGRSLDVGEKEGDLSGGKGDQTSGGERLSHADNTRGPCMVPTHQYGPFPSPQAVLAEFGRAR